MKLQYSWANVAWKFVKNMRSFCGYQAQCICIAPKIQMVENLCQEPMLRVLRFWMSGLLIFI